MKKNDVDLVAYPRHIDMLNALTHILGIIFGLLAVYFSLNKSSSIRSTLSGIVYTLSILAVYTVSSVYHALPLGELKRKARIVDHSTVPFLIAGTATPIAVISLYDVSVFHSILILSLAWFCAIFGLITKVFFFSKFKVATILIYIVCAFIMLMSALTIIDEINLTAYRIIIAGSLAYGVGALLYAIGRKYNFVHIIFHIAVLTGSIIHFYAIYTYALY